MFDRILGKKNDDDAPPGDERPLSDTTHTRARQLGGVVDAFIKEETVGEHTIRVIQDELLAACADAGSAKLTIDMSGVTMLASAGIGMLVTLHKRMRSQEGEIAIYNLNDDIQHLMKLTRMDRLFPIVDDLDAACKAVR